MSSETTLFKPLADRGPLNVAAAARFGSRVKQDIQPAAVSLTLGCWNVRSLGPQIETTPSSPRKSGIVGLELDRVRIKMGSLSETWWSSS